MPTRRLFALGGTAMLCGCAGTIHDLPTAPRSAISEAQGEIAGRDMPMRRSMSNTDVGAIVRRVHARLYPHAHAVCGQIGQGQCDWLLRISRSREINASASGAGNITINAGVVEMARSEDEVALVVGHEMAHHAANHLANDRSNMDVGGAVGAVMGAAAVIALASVGIGFRGQGGARITRSAEGLGRDIANRAFSRDQEREADHLSAIMLHRAGYDLAKAREFLVTTVRMSGRTSSTWLSTHPAGPERLAHFDAGVADILAGRVQLGRRA